MTTHSTEESCQHLRDMLLMIEQMLSLAEAGEEDSAITEAALDDDLAAALRRLIEATQARMSQLDCCGGPRRH